MGNSTPDYSIRKWLKTLFRHDGRDSPPELRNVLLVVATLIATVTFQAGVNPPGGVWQENKDRCRAGRAIYASDEKTFFVFLTSNTPALSSSILLVISLTWGFPFFFEVVIVMVLMVMTYGASIFTITPQEAKTEVPLPAVHCGGSSCREGCHSDLQICHDQVVKKGQVMNLVVEAHI